MGNNSQRRMLGFVPQPNVLRYSHEELGLSKPPSGASASRGNDSVGALFKRDQTLSRLQGAPTGWDRDGRMDTPYESYRIAGDIWATTASAGHTPAQTEGNPDPFFTPEVENSQEAVILNVESPSPLL